VASGKARRTSAAFAKGKKGELVADSEKLETKKQQKRIKQ